MSETWSASAAGFKKGEDRILIVGWTTFIASSVVNIFLLVAARSLGAPTVGIVEGLAGVVVSLLFVIIVRRIPARQIRKHTLEPFGDSTATEGPSLTPPPRVIQRPFPA